MCEPIIEKDGICHKEEQGKCRGCCREFAEELRQNGFKGIIFNGNEELIL